MFFQLPERNRMNPLISVIITVYNLEKYISQCLDSLVHQKCRDFEIIVVDDASTDKSVEICEGYISRYPDIIRLIKLNPPAELYRAHRAGLEAAHGEYLQFVDGDDYLLEGYVGDVAEIIRNKAPDVIIGRFISIIEDDALPYRDTEILKSHIDNCHADSVISYLTELPSYHLAYWRYIFKRRLVNTHLFESELKETEKCPLLDAVVSFRILLSANSFSLLERTMYAYRSRDNSTSTKRKALALWNVESFAEFLLMLKKGGYKGVKKRFIVSKLKQELKLVIGKSDSWEQSDWEYAALLMNKVAPAADCIAGDGIPDVLNRFRIWLESGVINSETIAGYFESEKLGILNKVFEKKNNMLYLFPCGRFSRDVQHWITGRDSINVSFIDNNPEMDGRVIQGSQCFTPEILKSATGEAPIVLVATIYEELDHNIRQQCLSLGVPEDNIIICCP
jgi:glycosyltransferase involved in cell wall biosynthesis